MCDQSNRCEFVFWWECPVSAISVNFHTINEINSQLHYCNNDINHECFITLLSTISKDFYLSYNCSSLKLSQYLTSWHIFQVYGSPLSRFNRDETQYIRIYNHSQAICQHSLGNGNNIVSKQNLGKYILKNVNFAHGALKDVLKAFNSYN